MKRLFLLLLVTLTTATFSFGQKIKVDKVESDGTRIVSTDYKLVRGSNMTAVPSYGIAGYSINDKVTYDLVVQLSVKAGSELHKNAKVLIKTFKGEVIEANVSNDDTAKEEVLHIGNTPFSLYYLYAYIPLTDEQLTKISTDGIQKLRIEGNVENYEVEYKKDKTSEPIKERLDLVKQTLSTKKSFSDGF